MEKEPHIIVEQIHLQAIENTQFRLLTDEFYEKDIYDLNVAHKGLRNLKDQRLKLELVLSNKDKANREILFFKTDLQFQVTHLSNFYKTDEKSILIFLHLLLLQF